MFSWLWADFVVAGSTKKSEPGSLPTDRRPEGAAAVRNYALGRRKIVRQRDCQGEASVANLRLAARLADFLDLHDHAKAR
jgi:hypothetical protein